MTTTTTCNHCDGTGEITTPVCISEFMVPRRHKNAAEIVEIKLDAIKAKSDHRKLCEMNPRAEKSYDLQLIDTLAKLNAESEALFTN